MPVIKYCTIPKYRLVIPLFHINEVYVSCLPQGMPRYLLGSMQFNVISFLISNTNTTLLGMFFVNLLTDPQEGRSTFMLANVLVYG